MKADQVAPGVVRRSSEPGMHRAAAATVITRAPRLRRWPLLVTGTAVVVALAGLTACGSDDSSEVPAASTSTTHDGPVAPTSTEPAAVPPSTEPAAVTTSTVTERPCEVDDGTGEDLRVLITDDLPPPYEAAPDGAEDTGPFDLQRATDDVTPRDGEVLRELRFRRGFSRLWYRTGSDDVDLRVYEFCEPEGAIAYERHTFVRLTTEWGFREIEARPLPPDTVALLYGTAGTDGYVSLQWAHGPYLILTGARSAGGESQESLVDRARMLLELQLAALS